MRQGQEPKSLSHRSYLSSILIFAVVTCVFFSIDKLFKVVEVHARGCLVDFISVTFRCHVKMPLGGSKVLRLINSVSSPVFFVVSFSSLTVLPAFCQIFFQFTPSLEFYSNYFPPVLSPSLGIYMRQMKCLNLISELPYDQSYWFMKCKALATLSQDGAPQLTLLSIRLHLFFFFFTLSLTGVKAPLPSAPPPPMGTNKKYVAYNNGIAYFTELHNLNLCSRNLPKILFFIFTRY